MMSNVKSDKDFSLKLNVVIFSILIGIGLYLLVSLYTGWQDIVSVFIKVGWLGLLIALALSMVNYVLRFVRWQMYLGHLGYCINTLISWEIYLSGFALTTTPGKAGEAIRSMYLKKHAVPVSSSLAALVSERLSDLIAIVVLSCFGLWQYPNAKLPVLLTVFFILGFLLVMIYRPILIKIDDFIENKDNKFYRIVRKIINIMQQMQSCYSPMTLMITTVISVIAWGAEAFALYLLLIWLGFDVSLGFSVFVYAISMLAGALSFLPGGLGGAEAAMVSLFMLKGIDLKTSVAVTIFIRCTTLWFAVILGIGALMNLQIKSRQEQ